MSDDSKKMVVKVDEAAYSVIKEFSEYINEDKDTVVNYLLKRTLNDFVKDYTNLKNGYVEMGNINLEISRAFTDSENEAFSHVE